MSNPRLNHDVLVHILHTQTATNKSDIVPMMQTCLTLQQAGAPLLVQGRVVIRDAKALASFYQFMFADKTRFRYLRRLDLDINPLQENDRWGKALSRVFKHARELEELSVEDSYFLDCYTATNLPY